MSVEIDCTLGIESKRYDKLLHVHYMYSNAIVYRVLEQEQGQELKSNEILADGEQKD